MTRPRALLLVAGLLVSALATAAAQEPPIIIVTTPQTGGPDLQVVAPASPLPAKERLNVFLSIVNVGPGAVHDPSIFIEPGSDGEIVIVGQAESELDDLAQDESGLLVVRVATPDRAGGASLVLRFTFTDDDGNIRSLTRTVSLQIAPPRSDPLEITNEETPLDLGKPGNVTILLRNPSREPITQLDVSVTSEQADQPISLRPDGLTPGAAGSLVLQGATIPPGSWRRVTVPVLTSLQAQDLLLFTVQVRYTFAGFERTQNFEFGARLVGTVQLRVLEAREVPGADGLEIVGSIVNVGSGTAWNPRIAPGEGSGLRAEGPKLIEDLEPNDAVDFRLKVERVAEPTPGAPLLMIDYNDDQGEIHPASVPGELARVETSQPTGLALAWARLSSLWFPLLVAAAVLLAAGLSLAHLAKKRREEREDEAAQAADDDYAARESDRHRGDKRRPGGKQQGGARPGA